MKSKTDVPIFNRSLFSWIWPGNAKLQIITVLVIAVTVGARVLPLEMQKRIINEAIRLRKIDLLYIYCGLYLGAVVLASGLKFLINVLQTYIAERTLANLRKEIYHHILTLPLTFFRRTQPGLVVSSLVTELTTAGNFAGMAISTPLINVLTLVAFAGYLFWLDPLLALVSFSIYPMVSLLVPLLQRGANRANKQRVSTTYKMSGKIAESITGVHEIHGNGAFHIENRKFDKLVDRLFKIRIVWTLYVQGVKVVNNFFTNLSPFFIFLLGGYFAMTGRLELGALVAFLSAQEKLYDPWKELIEFYQVYQDASVRYKKSMRIFSVMPEYPQLPDGRPRYQLAGPLEVSDLSYVTEDGISLISGINFDLKQGEHMALVGFSGSGKSTLAQCVGQLYKYTGGHISVDGHEVADLSKLDVAQNIGFVSQSPFIFDGTIEDNLLYSCDALIHNEDDRRAYPLPSRDEIIEVLQQTGVFVDVLRFGLNAILAGRQHAELVSRLVRVREKFRDMFADDLADYVEFFNEGEYLYYSTVFENLLFGTSNRPEFSEDNLPENPYFQSFLDEADLTRPLLTLGMELSRQTVDILGDLPPDKVFFERSPVTPEELDDYKGLVERLEHTKLHQLAADDRKKLLRLALRCNPGRHKTIALPDLLQRLLLEGRALFRDKIEQDDPGAVSFFQIDEYIHSQTILNNILFGKLKTDRSDAQEYLDRRIIQLLVEEELLETIVEIGMQFEVGSKGDRLSGGQRQKIAIARVFLKAPPILILDEATSALDNKSQARIQNQLETRWKGRSTVIAVVHRLDITKNFDRIAVMKAGKIVEMGGYQELMDRKGMLYELVTGKK